MKDGLKLVYAPDLFTGGARQGFDPYNVVRRLRYLAGQRWDLVHAFDARPVVSIPARRITREGRALLVMDWADWWGRGGTIAERSGWLVRTLFGPVETWFEEASRTTAQGTTVISEALAARARALGVPPATILRLPHGCDVSGFPVQERALARSRLGLPQGEAIVVHLGSVFAKDADLLLAAWRQLRERSPAARLVFVGRSRVRIPPDLADGGAVFRTGSISYETLQTWLGAADACVIPLADSIANRGRWPSKINDYFTAGRAVVMTDVSDAAGFVRESRAGWVAQPTAPALAEALGEALADRGPLAERGENARLLAESRLAWPVLTDRLDRFYAMLSSAPDGPKSGGDGR